MPTVLRVGPHRFFFFSNEGLEPPHIHVQNGSKLAKYWLDPVRLASRTAFKPHEIRTIEKLVRENRSLFHQAWDAYFGG
ncbi:MAG: DUF4160 domain-containing protein [Planctomycetota bacterium]|nr:DUF4160 domain-containing protein [Planctomycetota bacterium]